MNNFQPEIGQACSGYEVPELAIAALRHIEYRLETAYWNINQREMNSPFGNTAEKFDCETFSVHAYSWTDDNQPWNFRWRDVRISWYKYCGRGMSSNVKLTPNLIEHLLEDCLKAVDQYEASREKDDD